MISTAISIRQTITVQLSNAGKKKAAASLDTLSIRGRGHKTKNKRLNQVCCCA
jgi:hypothetical protein